MLKVVYILAKTATIPSQWSTYVDISHVAGAFQRIDQFRLEQNGYSMVSVLGFEPTLSKHSFNMPMDKHPFKPCSCKHKQALTDVLKPISTTSAPAKTNTAVPVNTSVFLPELNEKLIYLLFPVLISHRQPDTRIFKDK